MSRNTKSLAVAATLVFGLLGSSSTNAATVAYEVSSGTVGNQAFTSILAMDFVVNSAVNVLSLGAFDDTRSGLNGISAGTTLTTELWSRSGNTGISMLASETFTNSSEGSLIGGSRFKNLVSALLLNPGEYSIVGYGYNANDLNGNKGFSGTWGTNDGGGLLSFVGGGRFGGAPGSGIGVFTDSGPFDRYAAGTFEFEAVSAVPIPAALPLFLGALGLLGFMGRRRRSDAFAC